MPRANEAKERITVIGRGGVCKEIQLIRNGLEGKIWREAIYKRDDWTCQKCKERGKKLQIHHIKNFAIYPKLRFVVDNGISFCKKCHNRFHGIYSKKNNEVRLKEFLGSEVDDAIINHAIFRYKTNKVKPEI